MTDAFGSTAFSVPDTHNIGLSHPERLLIPIREREEEEVRTRLHAAGSILGANTLTVSTFKAAP